ncbi:MAG: UDP-N-acetylmuramate--L-alanine ligase [Anaerolineales bacterium]
MKHIHFVGIGGSGLSAIAHVCLERGEQVSGSDRQPAPVLDALRAAGAKIFVGQRAENIAGASLLVRSSAVPDTNPEVQAAFQQGIPVLKRADFLPMLLKDSHVIAIAGSHGKTTTTALVAWMLTALGLDPSYIIGGISHNLNGNAHAGKGSHFVIEADEYDRMFLGLAPKIAVITNVEHDHPDCYPTPEDFRQAFRDFVGGLLPDGILLACGDDSGAAAILQHASGTGRRTVSYGLAHWLGRPMTEYQARDLWVNPHNELEFNAFHGSNFLATLKLQIPGEHNARNALAALAIADLLGLSLPKAAEAIAQFRGTGRRFQLRGEINGITLIDDYAHHPTEIRATLQSARQRYPNNRIWAVWQPHTYSRTRTFFDDFKTAFKQADAVIVTEIYAARETAPEDGFSSQQVLAAMNHPQGYFAETLESAVNLLHTHTRPGDVVLVLSAGDADQINTRLLA